MESMRFSFRDLYPGGEGLTTRDRTVPEIEDKIALGAKVLHVDEEVRMNGRKWVTIVILLGLLVMFRYV